MSAITIIAEAPGTVQTIMSFFIKGGLFMWPLLACSIVSVTTIILRGIALREKNVMPLVIQSEIERLVPGGSPERLSRLVHYDQSSLARIARVALQHLRGPRSENVEVVETRARHEMVRLEKGLIVLEVITGIAPLLGLIGAVSGLVHVFSNLGLSSGASDTRQIALGISEALNATVFGLSIAVPTLIAFSYFSKKVEVMSVEMETLVVELISKCYYGRSSREVMPTKSPPLESAPTPTPVVSNVRCSLRYELHCPQAQSAHHHYRFVGRYTDHPSNFLCRFDDV